MKSDYEVVVGNVGTVYEGPNGFTAVQRYNTYVGISKRGIGGAGGEHVTLFKNGEIIKEFIPYEGGEVEFETVESE